MYTAEESIKELKNQIAKLDKLILMGEYYIHMVNTAAGNCTLEDLPPDVREDYIEIMKDIAESQKLKRNLEIIIQSAENIYNIASVLEDNADEGDEEDNNDTEDI